ncbi:MAG: tetratricopeptide repeat protein [Cytophaga sp.]|uniref:tetratricopeptide repeat protein n=1 Tax=Cytophaga sp. TaxID=29535 RepID=UPI003F8153E8
MKIAHILLFATCIAFFSCNTLSYEGLLFKGENAFNKGNYIDAIKFFSEAININKSDPQGYIFRGCCYNRLNQFELAIIDLQRAEELNGDPLSININLGESFYNTGKTDLAYICYNKAKQIDSTIYALNYNLGIYYYYSQNNINKAIYSYSQAIKNNEKNEYDVYAQRALCYWDIKEYGLALNDINKAISLKKDDDHCYLIKSSILYEMGQIKKAIETLTQCIKINNKNLEAYYYRANYYIEINDNQNACKDFDVLIRENYKEKNFNKTVNNYCR